MKTEAGARASMHLPRDAAFKEDGRRSPPRALNLQDPRSLSHTSRIAAGASYNWCSLWNHQTLSSSPPRASGEAVNMAQHTPVLPWSVSLQSCDQSESSFRSNSSRVQSNCARNDDIRAKAAQQLRESVQAAHRGRFLSHRSLHSMCLMLIVLQNNPLGNLPPSMPTSMPASPLS